MGTMQIFTTSGKDLHVKAAIQQVNLQIIKTRLMCHESGEGWIKEKADEVEAQYKHFLWLTYKHQGEPIVPSKDIDKFWHYHILDTRKYADDCAEMFGYFLHHIPSSGHPDESLSLNESFEKTKALFVEEFSDSFDEDSFRANAPCCGHGSCSSSLWHPAGQGKSSLNIS